MTHSPSNASIHSSTHSKSMMMRPMGKCVFAASKGIVVCLIWQCVHRGRGSWMVSSTRLTTSSPTHRYLGIVCVRYTLIWTHSYNDRLQTMQTVFVFVCVYCQMCLCVCVHCQMSDVLIIHQQCVHSTTENAWCWLSLTYSHHSLTYMQISSQMGTETAADTVDNVC